MPNRRNKTQLQLLQSNKRWVYKITQDNPNFFKKLAVQRFPKYLWIGCSDNRVPANELLGLLPGELFVHRNIANVVAHTDLNCLSVLQFSVDVLKVKNVIICGHYGCAGVRAILTKRRIGLADNWLQHIRDVYEKYIKFFTVDMSLNIKHNLLCELNVLEQVNNISRTTIITDAWIRRQQLSIHSFIYTVNDGLLRALSKTINNLQECNDYLAESIKNILCK